MPSRIEPSLLSHKELRTRAESARVDCHSATGIAAPVPPSQFVHPCRWEHDLPISINPSGRVAYAVYSQAPAAKPIIKAQKIKTINPLPIKGHTFTSASVLVGRPYFARSNQQLKPHPTMIELSKSWLNMLYLSLVLSSPLSDAYEKLSSGPS